MIKEKLVFSVLLLGMIKIACCQTINSQMYNSISKNIKTFDYNPTYQVRFKAVNCTYEVFVNDMLVTFSFSTGNTAGEQHADIPQYILNSGTQQVKIKVYPKAIKDGTIEDTIKNEAVFSGRIVHGEYGVTDFEDFTEVTSFKMAPSEGNTATEVNAIFNAKVPYDLLGWKTGMDLSKEGKTSLTREVLAVYERFAAAYKNKDITTISSMIYNREKEVAQAFFFKSVVERSYDKGWEKLSDEANSLVAIKIDKNAELRYFAGGKVVALLIPNGEDRDFPAIQGETEENYVYYALYLYRPKAGAPLEIIR